MIDGLEADADPDASIGSEIDTDTGIDAAAEAEVRAGGVDAAHHGQRLDKLLVAMAPEFSRSHLQRLIDAGEVQVNAVVSRVASRKLLLGQRVHVRLLPTELSQAYRPQPMALDVVHEDEHLLVINKPVGLVVHPAPGHWQGTLLNGLLARHPGAQTLPRAGIVHRLDKDTSGVMVVGKTALAVAALVSDIAQRLVQRRYLALAHGAVQQPCSVEAPIGRDPRSRLRMAVVAQARGGRAARTEVTPVAAGPISAVACRLHTGRTHQIRVHLAHIGHPLVADATYGGATALGMERQALHAWRLGLRHPVSGAWLECEAPLPADFRAAWAAVAGGTMPLV